MDKEEIISMAREAGMQAVVAETADAVERFAKLVAEKEREAIAKMIEDAPPLVHFCKNNKGGCLVCGFTPKLASETIRARGQD